MRFSTIVVAGFLALGACSQNTQEDAKSAANQVAATAVSAAHDTEADAKIAAAKAKIEADKAQRKADAASAAASNTN